jgi:hypothetical protein
MPIAIPTANSYCSILRLRSSDFHFFELTYSQALYSGFLKRLLVHSSYSNNCLSSVGDAMTVNLETIDSYALREVIKYIELLDLYQTRADLDQIDQLMSQFLHQRRNVESWEKILAAADFLEI